MTDRRVRWATAVALVALAAIGLWLVLDPADEPQGPGELSLTLEDTDAGSVATLAALELPDSTEGFLSARLDDGSQLDVTFTIAAADEDRFLGGSSLGTPVVDQRVILHSSPLWKLNPDGGIRGSSDTVSSSDGTRIARAVELTEENGRTRVRLVITPSE